MLRELRQAARLSQEAVAERLGVGQAAVSKVEHRTDVSLSTLRDYVEALGGHLEVRARVGDEEFVLQFDGAAK
jgi:transcriptional regulator with XRE-family HTH domain